VSQLAIPSSLSPASTPTLATSVRLSVVLLVAIATTACSAMRPPKQGGNPDLRGDEVATTMITATDMLPPPAPREPAKPAAAAETADASPVIELDDESPVIELDDESPVIELDDESPAPPPAKRASQRPKTDAEAIADVKIHR
jgi:hypothetical protein